MCKKNLVSIFKPLEYEDRLLTAKHRYQNYAIMLCSNDQGINISTTNKKQLSNHNTAILE